MIKVIAITLAIAGCASAVIIPDLPNRTLRISDKVTGFEYQYEVCAKKVLGICTKHEMHTDYYDLGDLAVKQRLIDMGFVAKVRDKILP